MEPQYHCQQPGRVAAVRAQSQINGIEYLEIASPDQRTLAVHFVHPLPDTGAAGEVPTPPPPAPTPKLAAINFRIDGGVRVTGIQVVSAVTSGHVVTLTTNAAGDFSTYTLRLVTSDVEDAAPEGFDPRLAALPFSFKAECPSEFDCKPHGTCPPTALTAPEINYLAKDYASFRRLMLDRLSVLMPDWRDRSPADPLVTLVETLAYEGDRLSYWQDAVATEAYLGTARSRISLRRHARLLDYRLHEGCNARTWVHFTAGQDGETVAAGSAVLTRGTDGAVILPEADAPRFEEILREQPVVFATLHDVLLARAHNEIRFHTWSNTQCCLPRGATRATLQNDPPLTLAVGDWLLFEEIAGPISGHPADADPAHRQVVRLTSVETNTDILDGTPVVEIAWNTADALTFPLSISTTKDPIKAVSVARANLALADHGWWIGPEKVSLETLPDDRAPRGWLQETGVTFAEVFDARRFADEAVQLTLPVALRRSAEFLTAARALATSATSAQPLVELTVAGQPWTPRRELLASDRFAEDFVVEVEGDGRTLVRFGDGVHGQRPPADATIVARYRVGMGRAGNIGPDALARVRTMATKVLAVRNPLAARGGVDPEPMEEVRQFAPQAFRVQERAVTEADWVEVAQRHPEVQRAAARFRWTGSWHTVFVTVDRRGGLPVAGEAGRSFRESLAHHLGRYRLAGYDLEINAPVFVPVDIKLVVCVKPGHFRSDVAEALLEVFSSAMRPNGTRGFFHPDNFTFGGPVHLSRIHQAAMTVPGVNHLQVVRLQRFGKLPATELADGLLPIAPLEVAQCDNDRSRPENGRFELEMEGGL